MSPYSVWRCSSAPTKGPPRGSCGVAAEGKVRVIGKRYSRRALPGYKQTLGSFLQDFHAKNPLKVGISREELRTRLPEVDQQVFQAALEEVVKEGGAEIDKDRV